MTARPLIAAVLGALLGAVAVAQTGAPAPPPDGEAGLLCSLARLHVVAGVGRRCLSGQDAPFQAAVGDAIARLEAHAGSAMSRGELDDFARSMAGDDRSDAAVCDEEGLGIYRSARDDGAEALQAEVERQLARPGPPRWGVCR